MLKKILSFTLCAVLALGITAMAEESDQTEYELSSIKVAVDGVEIDFPDQQPVLLNGRTYTPVRFLAEALGCEVEWNDEYERVDIINGMQPSEEDGTKISYHLKLGKKQIVRAEKTRVGILGSSNNKDGSKYTRFIAVEVENEPFLLNGRTMLPFRFVAEALGAFVYYDAENGIAHAISNEFDDIGFYAILSSQIAPYMLKEINNFRAENAVRSLTLDRSLIDAASWKAKEMVTKKYYGHENEGYPNTSGSGQFFAVHNTGTYPQELLGIGENIRTGHILTALGEDGYHRKDFPEHDNFLYTELQNDWGFEIVDLFVPSIGGADAIQYTPSGIIYHLCEEAYKIVAKDAFNAWKNSTGHRATMLSRGASKMGFGMMNSSGNANDPTSDGKIGPKQVLTLY